MSGAMPTPAAGTRRGAARSMAATMVVVAALALLGASRNPTSVRPVPTRLIVDPNTAPPAVLLALPRLGPKRVEAIVAARDQAAFQSLDDFDRRVRGIGPATLASLRPHLRIESKDARAPASASRQIARSSY